MLKPTMKCMVMMLFAATAANGQTTWYVDDDNCPGPGSGTEVDPFCSIQAGIDAAAANGDDVLVADGIYNELIDFDGKAITLHSMNGAAATTIDGTGLNGSVVKCFRGEGPDTVLEGFTITGGNADAGAGMFNSNSSPTVTQCTFSHNTANNDGNGGGGGMFNKTSSPTVTYCTFDQNATDFNGGGMFNVANSSPTVTHCTFSGNTARNGAGIRSDGIGSVPKMSYCTFINNTAESGGGVRNVGCNALIWRCAFIGNTARAGGGLRNISSSPTVTNCVFLANHALDDGGGCRNTNSFPTITNCIFSGNIADIEGGGMWNEFGSAPIVTNCTFSGNTACCGGAVYSETASTPMLINCILWGNSPDEIANEVPGDDAPTVRFSDVQGGLGVGTIDGGGNINVDPLFVDADGADDIPGTEDDDLRLPAFSPCIDMGDNASIPPDALDLDGDLDTAEATPFDLDDATRLRDGDLDNVETVDMGAYELNNVLQYFVDCFAGPDQTPDPSAPATPQQCLDLFDADLDDDVDLDDFGDYGDLFGSTS